MNKYLTTGQNERNMCFYTDEELIKMKKEEIVGDCMLS